VGVFAGPEVVEDGLVLALDAGNTKSYPGSGTTWTDLSGNGNNGTLTNGPSYSSDNGGSLSFDGVNDYIEFQSTTLSKNGGAFSIWVYIDDFSSFTVGKTVPSRILVRGDSEYQRLIALYNGGFGYETNTNSNPNDVASNTSPDYSASEIVAGSWFNFVLSNSGSVSSIYLNGTLNRTLSVSDDLQLAYIGRGQTPTNYPDFLKGRISNFKIYNRALTASEIQQNFNATRSRFGI